MTAQHITALRRVAAVIFGCGGPMAFFVVIEPCDVGGTDFALMFTPDAPFDLLAERMACDAEGNVRKRMPSPSAVVDECRRIVVVPIPSSQE